MRFDHVEVGSNAWNYRCVRPWRRYRIPV